MKLQYEFMTGERFEPVRPAEKRLAVYRNMLEKAKENEKEREGDAEQE